MLADPVPAMSEHMIKVVKAYVPTAEQRSVNCGVRPALFVILANKLTSPCSTGAATITRSMTRATQSSVSLLMVQAIGT